MPSLLKPDERAGFDLRFGTVREMPRPIPAADRFRFSIADVKVGGYIRFESKSYRVKGVNIYERDGVRWPELVLFCLSDGATRYLEWEAGDRISVYISRKKLSFKQVGIRNKEHLWEISEAESGAARYSGRAFSYHEDSAVTFYRDGAEPGTGFHQYLFADKAKKAYVSVEEWGNETEGYEHNVILSEYLRPESIEVLVAGSEEG